MRKGAFLRKEVRSFSMASQKLIDLVQTAENLINTQGISLEIGNALYKYAQFIIEKEKDVEYGLYASTMAKKCYEEIIEKQTGGTVWDLDMYCFENKVSFDILNRYYEVLKLEAPYRFESFLFFMEKKRNPKKRFYYPRMETMKIVVDDLQSLEDGNLDFYGLSLPPRVGKSTMCIFFLAWVIGKRPASHNAMSGHSNILAERFYDDVMKLTLNDEYTFKEMFPDITLYEKSAEKHELKFDEIETFATLTCRGIDGTWTGAVDISSDGYLYVDDMVRDRTESLSPKRLENRYQDYLNVLVDRKNDGSRELMVGTRWNVLDPLGKIKKEKKDNKRYFFREIPALDENDKSNFDYKFGVGFSSEYYIEIRNRLDNNEWMAKYQQRPFVREGLLFPADELRYYNGVIPDGFGMNWAACDVAWGGGDSLSMPFGITDGTSDGDIYIPAWVFNKGDKFVTRPLVTSAIINNKANMARFEANNGGEEYAEDIDTMLRERNYVANIQSKKANNKIGKLAKIIQYAPDIKRRCVFLAPELQDKEYREAMEELNMFVQIGDNEHDDSADGITQLFMLIDGDTVATVEATFNPFRGGRW